MTWDERALAYGTDKASSHHGYMAAYELLLGTRNLEGRSLLELGVAGGRSLALWSELLPRTVIVGVDRDASAAYHQSIGRYVVRADIADAAKMAAVHTLYGPFSVIIDDASHDPDDTRRAFEELFPRLCYRGVYVIEDYDEPGAFGERFEFTHRAHGEVIKGTGPVGGSLIVVEKP